MKYFDFRASMFRLYIVSETPDSNGNYMLEEFELEGRSRDFPKSQTWDELQVVLARLFGGGTRVPIGVKDIPDDEGNIHVEWEPEAFLTIPDIRKRIEADLGNAKFYVLFHRDLTKFRWIVCIPSGPICRGKKVAYRMPYPLPNKSDVSCRYELADDGFFAYLDADGFPFETEVLLKMIDERDRGV